MTTDNATQALDSLYRYFDCLNSEDRKQRDKYVEIIRKKIAGLTRALEPIETAPKDGSEILVYVEVAGQLIAHIAWYRSKEEWETSGKHTGFTETLEEWEGWWSYTQNSVAQEKLTDYKTPTHWEYLPQQM